jgi:hypothetical protein
MGEWCIIIKINFFIKIPMVSYRWVSGIPIKGPPPFLIVGCTPVEPMVDRNYQ